MGLIDLLTKLVLSSPSKRASVKNDDSPQLITVEQASKKRDAVPAIHPSRYSRMVISLRNKLFPIQISTSNNQEQPSNYVTAVKSQLNSYRKAALTLDARIQNRVDILASRGEELWEKLDPNNCRIVLNDDPRSGVTHQLYILDRLPEYKGFEQSIPTDSLLYQHLISTDDSSKNHFERLQKELNNAFLGALDFLKVDSLSYLHDVGIVIPGFTISKLTKGNLYAGSSFGCGVNYKEVEKILKAIIANNEEEIKNARKDLEGNFVHEIGHLVQNSVSDTNSTYSDNKARCEVAPFALQILHNGMGKDNFLALYFRKCTAHIGGDEYDKAAVLALKLLHHELSSHPVVKELGLVPIRAQQGELKKTLDSLNTTSSGKEVISEITQRIITTTSDVLYDKASKLPEDIVQLLQKIEDKDGVVNIYKDENIAAPALTIIKQTKNGEIIREVRLSKGITDDLNRGENKKAQLVLDKAIEYAKLTPVPAPILVKEAEGIKYVICRLYDELVANLKVNNNANYTNKDLQEIDRFIKEGMHNDALDKILSLKVMTHNKLDIIDRDLNENVSSDPSVLIVQRSYVFAEKL